MKSSKRCFYLLFIALGFILISCSKDGPEGPMGPQGEQGTQGDKGDKGDIGTANVQYSDWLGADFVADLLSYVATFEAPEITEEILNSGNIVFYMRKKTGDNFTYTKLNYTLTLGGSVNFVMATPKVGEFVVSATIEADAPEYGFRYIIIPGGIPISASEGGDRSLDLTDYQAVANQLDIAH